MKAIKIKKEFQMTQDEISNYRALPDNLPDTKLTEKQKRFVWSLYHKYIGTKIDNQDWSPDMYKVEQREKWPSGPRVKEHEAKRMILSNLCECCENRKSLTPAQAVCKFHSALTMRPMYAKLLSKIYNVDYKY
ncbi:MAG: hypothetical protein PHY56_07890 [Candidatus Omnitrophica bacterium]|nr:hypothetical protein [Candidatus Omnitrophota bacterium]